MANRKRLITTLLTVGLLVGLPLSAKAQTAISEDFTGTTTTNSWWFFNGACLTASSLAGAEPSGSSAGQIPGCTTIASSYFGENLVGGQNGVTGSSQTLPDPTGSGALRFTNGSWTTAQSSYCPNGSSGGYCGGFNQSGGIVFATPFPSGQGVAITFKTVTYRGNSGGSGDDGADGMSFFLMDATQLNTSAITGTGNSSGNGLGSFGGSLGYTCSESSSHAPWNGLIGGYVGLGIDEYGNFLNGTTNTLNESGTTASGDNTASGGGYQPDRIALRGAGNIAWSTLNGAYSTNPNNTAMPYYPSSLATSCVNAGGSYSSSTQMCESCPTGYTLNSGGTSCTSTMCSSGTYNSTTGLCEACSSGTYSATTGNCQSCSTGTYDATTNKCESCSSGSSYDATTNQCQSCSSGSTYNSTVNECLKACNSGYTLDSAATECGTCSSGSSYYNSTTNTCSRGTLENETPSQGTLSSATPTASSPITATSSPTETATPTTNGYPDNAYAVKNTCANGTLYNYSSVSNPTSAGATSLSNTYNTGSTSPYIAPILDYTALPNGYVVLPTGTKIANESAMSRPAATPIFYQLKITQNGLLSLSYATCPPGTNGCGAYNAVITNYNITTQSGALPANLLFGFAGSTGGSTNIHEILCFKAQPATSSASSAGASEKESAKLVTGAQVYFAYYNPADNWTGDVTASNLSYDQYGNITIAATPNWDASCDLTGVRSGSTCTTTGAAGPIAAEAPASRVMLTWNGTSGVAFEWPGVTSTSVSTAQQTALTAGDSTSAACNSTTAYATSDRLNYLRGARSCEINSSGVGLFRRRTSVLADIIDSSPTWVGAPDMSYTQTWTDRINALATMPENASTAQTYPAYVTAQQTRLNVVYAGGNDGLMHGFRSGYYNGPNNFVNTNNDGVEVLAYMPGAVVNSTVAQNIHSSTANIDYSNANYGHDFYVDATPGTGDLFFQGAWHTWLVSGLGPGGNAIFALDVTNPGLYNQSGSSNFSESNPTSLVMGEWNSSTITCVNVANCGNNLGATYGTPQIRRLHDGNWAVLFGNGIGSSTGDAGLFIMLVNSSTGAETFYYLTTNQGTSTQPGTDGIAYVTPADFDGDHITDYVYAGDLNGNVWRFDLTSATESNWAVTPGPVFSTPSGQPITTEIVAAAGAPTPNMPVQVMLLFGTGEKFPLTNASPATYATAVQSLYGVWDWNMTEWNSLSTTAQYASMTGTQTGLTTSHYTIKQANLAYQTVTIGVDGNRDIDTPATICWAGQTGCTGGAAQFGWYLNLPGSQEQVIYNPELVAQALTVNTIVPAPNSPTSCATNSDTGFTYVLNAITGAPFNEVFLPPSEDSNPAINNNPAYTDQYAIGIQTNATGTSVIIQNNNGGDSLVYQTNQTNSGGTGSGGSITPNLPPNTTGRRLSWVELR